MATIDSTVGLINARKKMLDEAANYDKVTKPAPKTAEEQLTEAAEARKKKKKGWW